MTKMKFLDLFSGIGGFRFGLEMAGHECVGHVEIDKYANQSYRAIHQPKESEFFHEDITTITDESIRELRDRGIDIIAGGFPCQAFSIAGKRAGFEDTRGTLFFDIARMARILRPKYLFLENVKGLLNHDRGDTFETILRALDELGYDAEWQVLNSKHFGVPQNRERVFIIGNLRGSGGGKVFPFTRTDEPIDTEHERLNPNMALCKLSKPYVDGKFASLTGDDVTIRDIGCEIAGTVTARYYKGVGADNDNAVIVRETTKPGERVSQKAVSFDRKNGIGDELETAHALNASDWRGLNRNQVQNAVIVKEATKQGINQIGNLIDTDSFGGNPQVGRVYGTDGISPCLNTMGGGGREPKILIRETDDQKYIDGISDKYSFAKKKAQEMLDEKGFLPERFNPYNSQELGEVSPTVTACCDRTTTSSTILMKQPNFRIRKLTPKECWRLQGFPDWAFERAKAAGVSDSQLYKQAGNSVTVNVVYEIGKRLK